MTNKSDNKKIIFSTRQDSSLIKRAKRYAIDYDMTLQEVVALALEELLKKKSGPNK